MPASLKTSCRIIQLSYKKIKRLIGYSANRAYSVSLYCLQMLLKLRFCVVKSADNRPIAAFFALFVPLKQRFYKIFGFVFLRVDLFAVCRNSYRGVFSAACSLCGFAN